MAGPPERELEAATAGAETLAHRSCRLDCSKQQRIRPSWSGPPAAGDGRAGAPIASL